MRHSRFELCLHSLRLDLHHLLRLLDRLHKLAHVKWVWHTTSATLQASEQQKADAGYMFMSMMHNVYLYARAAAECMHAAVARAAMLSFDPNTAA
jgi:hypothetical protein